MHIGFLGEQGHNAVDHHCPTCDHVSATWVDDWVDRELLRGFPDQLRGKYTESVETQDRSVDGVGVVGFQALSKGG